MGGPVLAWLVRTVGLAALGVLAGALVALGVSVLMSEVAWAVRHKTWPRPLASLIGLLVLGLGAAGLWWLFWGRA